MTENPVIIAGGGIGGLATALTLHQIGVRCIVYEAVRELRPLGVGINLQPNAVRELYDLGVDQGCCIERSSTDSAPKLSSLAAA
jgi:2-polyprenyl-6-methoxyphenol hydroxylase-like FAD-dependent oxidoreductase